jgi:hypothetical protein
MGLDMYLKAEKFVSSYGWEPPEERATFDHLDEAVGISPVEGTPHLSVSVAVAYWRKANQIHNWFVQNVQDGVDNCQRFYVDREQLQELRDLSRQAMEAYDAGDKQRCAELLPPAAGFFFGSTEVDEYYRQDLEDTVKQLDNALQLPDGFDFYYQSSW